jgi:hypothetical protein
MKTVRFTSVVEESGRPEVYLLLVDPKKDPEFQQALKADRLMTLHHAPAGGKTDFGEVGYDPGVHGQVLVFPRSLKKFSGARVIGIDYDLLKEDHAAGKKAPKAKPAGKEKPTPAPRPKQARDDSPAPAPAKVIPFSKPEPEEPDDEESDDVADIKAVVRRALKALEAGKQVAAFNLLKRIVE